MADNFNADFYVTCATVIPVLFLAVAVQGQAYEAVLRSARRAARTARNDPHTLKLSSYTLLVLLGSTAYLIAGVIWSAGGAGEILALLTLYGGREDGSKLFVHVATLILVISAIAGPFARWWTLPSRRDDGDGDTKAASPSGTPPAGDR